MKMIGRRRHEGYSYMGYMTNDPKVKVNVNKIIRTREKREWNNEVREQREP